MIRLLLCLSVLLATAPAHAALTKAELDTVGVDRQIGTSLPGDVPVETAGGEAMTLGEFLGERPTLMLFADYTCETSCGVSFEALLQRLQGLSFTAGEDYRLVVVGIDAKDGPTEATTFKEEHLPSTSRWRDRISFLSPDQAGIDRLTGTIGYRYTYDAERDQFAHPTLALLIDADGKLARYVDPFLSRPLDMRLALVDAGNGNTGSVADQLLLMCYGWDPATGVYTPIIDRILTGAAVLTVLAIAGLLLALRRRERRDRSGEGQHV